MLSRQAVRGNKSVGNGTVFVRPGKVVERCLISTTEDHLSLKSGEINPGSETESIGEVIIRALAAPGR
jgi:hypothetical protein